MNFGNGFTYIEPSDFAQLEDGIYTVAIDSVTDDTYSNGNVYLTVHLRIKDHANAYPNTITINDRPKVGTFKANGTQITEKDAENWDKSTSRFFDCFGFLPNERNFNNVMTWKNKIGLVKCAPKYDANEPDNKSKKYKALFPQLPGKTENTSAAIPQRTTPEATAQAIAKETGGVVVSGGFPEDISF